MLSVVDSIAHHTDFVASLSAFRLKSAQPGDQAEIHIFVRSSENFYLLPLGKNLLDLPDRVIRSLFWRHPFLDDTEDRLRPDILILHRTVSWM